MSPVSFKRPISVIAYEKTPKDQLIECTGDCGGLNARGRVAVKIDCVDCDQTGYSNFYTQLLLPAYYTPGPIERWNAATGSLVFRGECSLKFDAKWRDILDRADFLYFNGAQWNFSFLQDPGFALGQSRLIYALTRR